MPFAAAAFDVVIWRAAADSDRARETLARLSALVRPGGMLIVGGYNRLGRLFAAFQGKRSDPPAHARVSAGEAAHLLEEQGFTVTSAVPSPDDSAPHQALRANDLQTAMATASEGGLMLLIGRRDRWQ